MRIQIFRIIKMKDRGLGEWPSFFCVLICLGFHLKSIKSARACLYKKKQVRAAEAEYFSLNFGTSKRAILLDCQKGSEFGHLRCL